MIYRAFLLSLLLVLSACGDDATEDAPATGDIYAADITGSDVVAEPDTYTPPPDGVVSLNFAESMVGDGVSCVGKDHCTLIVPLEGKRSLQAVYTVDGIPVESAVVYYEITDDPMELGSLKALSALTDESGMSSVDAEAAKPAQGEFVVRAYVTDETVPPLYFNLVVTSKLLVPLTIATDYQGTSTDLTQWVARLYAQDADGEPSCDDPWALYEATTVSATIQSPPKPLNDTVKFLELPGLVEGGQQRYTVLAYGEREDTDGDPILQAWGCNDVEAVVTTTEATVVEVPLVDRPPTFAGTYDVTTYVDLSTGIPEPYKSTVDLVLGLFESPAAQLLSLACGIAAPDSTIEYLCGLVYQDPTAPSLESLTATGAVVVDLINAVITDMAAGTAWGVALTVGKDVADMLTQLELHATLTFNTEAGADGAWTVEETSENWNSVVLKWGLNANCDPEEDENCGETILSMSAIQEETVTANFAATLDDDLRLSIPEHALNLFYGKLLDAVLQKMVLPLAAGDGSDGTAAIDSYEDLMQMLVGGGKACLDPSHPISCCQAFVEALEGQVSLPGDATAGLVETACEDLVLEGSDWLSESLISLDAADGLLIGTQSPCASYDLNNDLEIDAFGSKEQGQECRWLLTVGSGGTPATFEATFVAVRAD